MKEKIIERLLFGSAASFVIAIMYMVNPTSLTTPLYKFLIYLFFFLLALAITEGRFDKYHLVFYFLKNEHLRPYLLRVGMLSIVFTFAFLGFLVYHIVTG